MFQLAIIASFFIFVSGAVFHLSDLLDNDVTKINLPNLKVITIGSPDPLWILSLDDESLDFEKLRMPSSQEEEIFDRVVKPMIRSFRRRPPTVKKDDAAKNESELTAESHNGQGPDHIGIKQEIMRIINKFATSMLSEPDSYLSESEEELSLKLYFKGPYTSLMVISGRKQWHYFIGPPSPLPAWFYEKHRAVQQNGGEKYVNIPKTVRDEFSTKILHLLHMLLSHPM